MRYMMDIGAYVAAIEYIRVNNPRITNPQETLDDLISKILRTKGTTQIITGGFIVDKEYDSGDTDAVPIIDIYVSPNINKVCRFNYIETDD